MKIIYIILSIFITNVTFAQKANNTVIKANELYKKGDIKNAEALYDEALKIDNKNTAALFNKGNTLFKQNRYNDAIKQYQTTAETSTDVELQAKAYYNKAAAEIKQQQYQQAIQSLKQSLKLNNNDEQARENLQKLLTEINKQKQQQQQKQEKPPKEKPLNKEEAAKQLEMLRNEEKRLQKEIQQQKNKPSKYEKDW
ncbi:tetratricopeptide repeat protein [Parasediminibacterium paludis]|uniref:Tetratricopeptide repeat protein n=1 Tax=Parasediminibacterium paludis TaxID=908966 RepID=A0ABV8Q0I9_9BACT